MTSVKELIQSLFLRFGYVVSRDNAVTADMDPGFAAVRRAAKPYSMTSVSNMFALYKAVEYIVRNDIPGGFAECGVWRGGSAMTVALTLLAQNAAARDIYLFDTFAGMTPAGPEDVLIRTGESASEIERKKGDSRDHWIVAYASLEEVQENMRSTGYPWEKLHFIQGDVARTLETTETGPLSLVRLDTDWYDSTLQELKILYPRLVSGGVLIIDDYGSWAGARKAVDEFVAERRLPILLTRVDGSSRLAVKP